MAQEIMLDPSLVVTPVTDHKRDRDSKEALAASLHKLEELAEVIAQEEVSGGKESFSTSDFESFVNRIRDVLVKDPSAFDDVLRLIAPQTKGFGKELLGKLVDVKKSMEKFSVVFSRLDKETYQKGFEEHIAPHLSGFGETRDTLSSLCVQLRPLLEDLYCSDPMKFQPFLQGLLPVLVLVSARNPEKANDVIKGFTATLEKSYQLPERKQRKFFKELNKHLVTLSRPDAPSVDSLKVDPSTKSFLKAYVDSGNEQSPDMSGSLAQVMIILQLFQMALSQMQIDKDNIQSQIGDASIKVAQLNQIEVAKEINKANAEAEAARHRPWWETFVEVVVCVVGAVVAALTGGAGAAIVAVGVGAFMASPGFSDCVSALGGVITDALEAAGMSADKAKALGDMIAKVIIIVVVAVASAGLGGIGAAADGATNAAAEAAVDATVDATVGATADTTVGVTADTTVGATADAAATSATDSTATAVSDETSSVMKNVKSFYKSLTKPFDMGTRGKIFTFELVSNLATSNIWMDGMEMDPEFMQKHQKLVEALGILSTIIGTIVSMIVGAKCFSGVGGGKTLLEKFPKFCKGAIAFNFATQVGSGSVEADLASQRTGFLEEEARILRKIGESQANIVFSNATLEASSASLNQINSSAVAITKQIAEMMSTLCNNSGAAWNQAARVLAH